MALSNFFNVVKKSAPKAKKTTKVTSAPHTPGAQNSHSASPAEIADISRSINVINHRLSEQDKSSSAFALEIGVMQQTVLKIQNTLGELSDTVNKQNIALKKIKRFSTVAVISLAVVNVLLIAAIVLLHL